MRGREVGFCVLTFFSCELATLQYNGWPDGPCARAGGGAADGGVRAHRTGHGERRGDDRCAGAFSDRDTYATHGEAHSHGRLVSLSSTHSACRYDVAREHPANHSPLTSKHKHKPCKPCRPQRGRANRSLATSAAIFCRSSSRGVGGAGVGALSSSPSNFLSRRAMASTSVMCGLSLGPRGLCDNICGTIARSSACSRSSASRVKNRASHRCKPCRSWSTASRSRALFCASIGADDPTVRLL